MIEWVQLQVQQWYLILAVVNAVLGATAVYMVFWSMEAEVIRAYIMGMIIIGGMAVLERRWIEGLYGSAGWSTGQIRDLVFVMVLAAFVGVMTGAWMFSPSMRDNGSASGSKQGERHA
jgi:hypothetical protein